MRRFGVSLIAVAGLIVVGCDSEEPIENGGAAVVNGGGAVETDPVVNEPAAVADTPEGALALLNEAFTSQDLDGALVLLDPESDAYARVSQIAAEAGASAQDAARKAVSQSFAQAWIGASYERIGEDEAGNPQFRITFAKHDPADVTLVQRDGAWVISAPYASIYPAASRQAR